jgi:hypothetical protein
VTKESLSRVTMTEEANYKKETMTEASLQSDTVTEASLNRDFMTVDNINRRTKRQSSPEHEHLDEGTESRRDQGFWAHSSTIQRSFYTVGNVRCNVSVPTLSWLFVMFQFSGPYSILCFTYGTMSGSSQVGF